MSRVMLRPKQRLKKLPTLKTELERRYPNAVVECWAFDEHRLGLKPIVRKIWAPVGQRPVAEVNYRYEWTYLYGFVHPHTGQTEWLLVATLNNSLGFRPYARRI